MILKNEILQLAKNFFLEPTTVEKDYILSWVLFGISNHPKLSVWLFKGGTCLKKCYFETYRFSEDLDFTVPEHAIYDKESIIIALNEVADIVFENTGINLKIKPIEVKDSINKNKKMTFTAKCSYLGPLNIQTSTPPRIKFDITNDEIIVDVDNLRDVFHSYTDRPEIATKVRCYSINEILAEKSRALYERQGRSRDIYDIVNISRNFRAHVDARKARDILVSKFNFKKLPPPSVDLILSQINIEMVKPGWEGQLKHQLQVLPPAESFFLELHDALSWWIDEEYCSKSLEIISKNPEEHSLARRYFALPLIANHRLEKGSTIHINYNQHIELIRYAARNRLCIKLEYNGAIILVEPYALRQIKNKNILLYAYDQRKGNEIQSGIRAYDVKNITKIEVTQQSFTPRYVIEI